jgi:hypothetical protein
MVLIAACKLVIAVDMDARGVLAVVSIIFQVCGLMTLVVAAAIIIGWARRYPEEARMATDTIGEFLHSLVSRRL